MIIFLRLISILCLCAIAYLCWHLQDYKSSILACSGFITGILFVLSYVLDISRKLKSYKRELEKSSVLTDESDSKVKVLESKIKVLEKALDEALKK